ncbi:hypothetical protein ASD50_21640 [Mesorhizobium sp. Root552]|nr:hypothetical protein ASD50_21640 [Mesorhizobium sp. Root552]
MKPVWIGAIAALLGGCTSTQTMRASADTIILQTSAAPACGQQGAARVAEQMAALETLKAGYDRYIILGADGQNNVSASLMPGTFHTTGTVRGGWVNTSTVYTPGPVIYSGSHDQGLVVKMIHDNDPNAAFAISARNILGPKWQEKLKAGAINTCL